MSLLPPALLLAALRDGRLNLPFGEVGSRAPPVDEETAFVLHPASSPIAGAPPADASTAQKADWALKRWIHAHKAIDLEAWQEFSELLSNPEWEEFWRTYPYTHNIRKVCREYAAEAGMRDELAQLDASEPEMRALLDAARLRAPAGQPRYDVQQVIDLLSQPF